MDDNRVVGIVETLQTPEGKELLTRRAECGDSQSSYILAKAYLHLIDGVEQVVPFDTGYAGKYFAIAVENGEDSHDACYYAGLAYFYGEGVPKNMERARKYLEVLIDDAYVPDEKVFDLLGCMCFEGCGGPADYTLGEKALRRAIKSDDRNVSLGAMNNLGMYLYTLEDWLQVAIGLLQSAASQGNADAQVNLGTAYYEGKGVTQNPETAAYYFELAAKQGSQIAIDNLSVMATSKYSGATYDPMQQRKTRHPIRGAIRGFFIGGFIGAILFLFWPGVEWICVILGIIIGYLKG